MTQMKKYLLSVFFMIALAFGTSADICISTDPDYDPIDCALNGGTTGVAIGISGSPGAPPVVASDVPVDGGASILALAGLAYARRRMNKKAE